MFRTFGRFGPVLLLRVVYGRLGAYAIVQGMEAVLTPTAATAA